ncbi:hypothetical protein ACFST9_00790 [Hymenobacter monticola]|uniref:Carboxypeptidase regulatory-like domain-containing protein n=1 Tax=Hymenobacter monticola TaxID=1705399 RepID=A0ABY4B2Y0_9BACT|nr:hypothetical protein [Hymenobacter monticola]UOE33499.1 hypothetical protein MTP16_20540 [Hymenobacter monticola]
MKLLVLFILSVVAMGLTACQLFQEPTTTTVSGTIRNKYTQQPLAGVPIRVRLWHYGLGMSWTDSIARTRSDAAGHYSVTFDATARSGTYRVDFKEARYLWDLTDYRGFDSHSFLDGASFPAKQATQVDFDATPFVPVRIIVEADKQGSSTLTADAFANEQAGQSYFHPFTLVDTARTISRVSANRVAYFVPNWQYDLVVWRSPVPPASFGTWVRFNRFVGYNDTTVIRLH